MNIPMERHHEPRRPRGPRRLPTALIACALAASSFALPPSVGAQPTGAAAVPPLIVFGQARGLDAGGSVPGLTGDQAATLDALRSDPRVSDIRLGQSAPVALADVPVSRALSIPVPGAAPEALSFTGVAVEHQAEGMVSLRARKEATDSSVSLVVQGADVLGSLRHGAEIWRVAPLGGGLTAVYRYDTSGLLMDPPGWGMRQRLLAPEPKPMDDAGASIEETDTGDVIDLMVVYTPAAAALGNIDTFIQFAIDNTHEAYRNSAIPFRLRLVHKAQVQYTQHASAMAVDLGRLTRPDDGYMDEVHRLRDRHAADLVALLVAGPVSRVCGVAWVPSFGREPDTDFDSQGFSVTGRSCEAADYRVFAHEVGHNQGALHDPYNSVVQCPTGPDTCVDDGNYPWRFGRCNTEQGWHTVMAYRSRRHGGTGECRQSTGRFSSPDVIYQGTPTGDAARRDNRRVLLETARRVANYRQSIQTPEPPDPPPPPPGGDVHATLPYVAPVGSGHPSLVRVLNDSGQSNTVQVTGYDDTGRRFGPQSLTLMAHQAVTLTSTALESGGSGFAGLGNGEGWWRLALTGERALRAGMYYRTADGFLAELSVPVLEQEGDSGGYRYEVGFFNPGSNTEKVSRLRLANPAASGVEVVIAGRDDAGAEAPGGTVAVTLPAQGATTLTARVLETGGSGLTGRLGDGEGKWRLTVTADRPVLVMSLLHATQTGHLANLSAIVQGTQGSTPPPGDGPDLVVEWPAVSANGLIAGARFTLSARVRNQGGAASAATTLRYYRSTDETISTSDTGVGTDAVGSLSAAGTSDESISLTAPSSAGTYYYGACVDSVAGEPNTGNNCSSAVRTTVTAAPAEAPDLAVADVDVYVFTYSPSGYWWMNVHNIGNADSPGTTARVSTRGQEFDTDVIWSFSLRAGSISGSAFGSFSTLAANAPRAGDTVTFCVDAVPNERNTANNCMTATARCFIGCPGEASAPASAEEEQIAAAQAVRALEARRARLRALEESAGQAKQSE